MADGLQSRMEDLISTERVKLRKQKATKELLSLVQIDRYVGEVFSLGYETALVQVHDRHRMNVGGIPSLSFLVATRLTPRDVDVDLRAEDSSVILLRVLDAAPLPNDMEAQRVRVEAAQRVSGEIGTHWDGKSAMDTSTSYLLSFAGIKCRVIGSFYADDFELHNRDQGFLHFGSDISNYYPNRGLKVYKPNDEALAQIANFRDANAIGDTEATVEIGHMRYASTNRSFQGIGSVSVRMSPLDLQGTKTALFGMTRTGKSNTTKIILKSIFDLRYSQTALRVGQLVIDPNGEYANENLQDAAGSGNPSAIKLIWKGHGPDAEKDVVTYGIHPHTNDPGRKLMLTNFFADSQLQIGKEIIDSVLEGDTAKYIRNFTQVIFEERPNSRNETVRYDRRVLAYRALLSAAGFAPPSTIRPATTGLFKAELLTYMKQSGKVEYLTAAETLGNPAPSWSTLATALKNLGAYIADKDQKYAEFESRYIEDKKRRAEAKGEQEEVQGWADDSLLKILDMFQYPNGTKQLGQALPFHTPKVSSDYAEDILKDLHDGKLVIVDQATGDPQVNKSSADRLMWTIFRANQKLFRDAEELPPVIIYLEEAHNVLPKGSDEDLGNVWVRTAKEGAKYNIGLVYSTQEVSSIQKNILKNTSNWFIGHLNNTDETRELRKYYDFADFESSILRAQDKGFIRMKTLSNLYVVPIQVNKFEVETDAL